jgi:hypothetical protein
MTETRMWRDVTAHKALTLVELASSRIGNRGPQPEASRHAVLGKREQRLAGPPSLMRWRYKKLIQAVIVFPQCYEANEIHL